MLGVRTLGLIGGLNVEDAGGAFHGVTVRLTVKLAGAATFWFTDGPPTRWTIYVFLRLTGGLPNFLRMIDVSAYVLSWVCCCFHRNLYCLAARMVTCEDAR